MIPDWFSSAIAQQASSQYIKVLGKSVHYRVWPAALRNENAPSLLFVHGHAAHSHWWDFIAPAFSQQYRTGAIDLTGNGDSEHREKYKASQFAQEIADVAEQLGHKTIVVAHSFGGSMARIAAHLYPQKIGALILVDSVISPHKREAELPTGIAPPKIRHYDSKQQAARRFRLRPPQPKPAPFILEHIAGHSIKQVGDRFQFKLDSQVFDKMWPEDGPLPDGYSMVKSLNVPCAYIWGQHSRFCPPEAIAMLSKLFDNEHLKEIEDAYHHLFLDQPERFIEVLAELLNTVTGELR